MISRWRWTGLKAGYLLLFAVCCFLPALMTGCSPADYRDGSYRAEAADFDQSGWKDYVQLTVSGGKVTEIPAYTRRRLITCPCYTVDKWDIETEAAILQDHPFLIVDVLDGQGTADGHPIRKGDHFILPCGYGICTLKGNLSLITSHI